LYIVTDQHHLFFLHNSIPSKYVVESTYSNLVVLDEWLLSSLWKATKGNAALNSSYLS
jgi:hypothetical protein